MVSALSCRIYINDWTNTEICKITWVGEFNDNQVSRSTFHASWLTRQHISPVLVVLQTWSVARGRTLQYDPGLLTILYLQRKHCCPTQSLWNFNFQTDTFKPIPNILCNCRFKINIAKYNVCRFLGHFINSKATMSQKLNDCYFILDMYSPQAAASN